ncbi:hypothetical protein HK096_003528 [Nowakowskiella sp. JEL0078]|nr:hypothetical protein HK096_003528 [Nowakowskiella sp. JEL0078]
MNEIQELTTFDHSKKNPLDKIAVYDVKSGMMNTPKYSVISHVWGDAQEFYVQGQKVRIRNEAKLRTLLQVIEVSSVPVWCDILSIKQEITDEVVEQMKVMHKIYGCAQQCIVLLPPEDSLLLDNLYHAYLDWRIAPTDRMLKERVLAVKDAWLHSQYMTRAWTAPELILASAVTYVDDEFGRYICGSEEFGKYVDFVSLIGESELDLLSTIVPGLVYGTENILGAVRTDAQPALRILRQSTRHSSESLDVIVSMANLLLTDFNEYSAESNPQQVYCDFIAALLRRGDYAILSDKCCQRCLLEVHANGLGGWIPCRSDMTSNDFLKDIVYVGMHERATNQLTNLCQQVSGVLEINLYGGVPIKSISLLDTSSIIQKIRKESLEERWTKYEIFCSMTSVGMCLSTSVAWCMVPVWFLLMPVMCVFIGVWSCGSTCFGCDTMGFTKFIGEGSMAIQNRVIGRPYENDILGNGPLYSENLSNAISDMLNDYDNGVVIETSNGFLVCRQSETYNDLINGNQEYQVVNRGRYGVVIPKTSFDFKQVVICGVYIQTAEQDVASDRFTLGGHIQ